ncbi:hypothetical protein C2G38_2103877 [Gigaspora rosea]|uniref:Uncharacterized protein n=1 Tax=Gigaspora rosea TaxID=44941 RepID=A0A397UM43_9GLOM|nr:hypothetical protein C2G38_2103877 [Gigaspora rosea]
MSYNGTFFTNGNIYIIMNSWSIALVMYNWYKYNNLNAVILLFVFLACLFIFRCLYKFFNDSYGSTTI